MYKVYTSPISNVVNVMDSKVEKLYKKAGNGNLGKTMGGARVAAGCRARGGSLSVAACMAKPVIIPTDLGWWVTPAPLPLQLTPALYLPLSTNLATTALPHQSKSSCTHTWRAVVSLWHHGTLISGVQSQHTKDWLALKSPVGWFYHLINLYHVLRFNVCFIEIKKRCNWFWMSEDKVYHILLVVLAEGCRRQKIHIYVYKEVFPFWLDFSL